MKKYVALLLAFTPLFVQAEDTVFTEDFTQEGGSLPMDDDAILVVSHSTNDPKLTFTENAETRWSGATVIGSLAGESGRLEVRSGSQLETTGTSLYLKTYGTQDVYRGRSYLGLNSGSEGSALVSGANSHWAVSEYLRVGYYGKGALRIEEGGTVSSQQAFLGYASGSEGVGTVSGANSEWSLDSYLYVGYHGSGELRIDNAAKVFNTTSYVGRESGGEGTVVLSGVGTEWVNSADVYVGRNGKGSVRVEDGAILSSVSGHLGYSIDSEGTIVISGEGSKWENSGYLHVGRFGKAELRIEDGGTATGVLTTIGDHDHAEGSVVVTGAGSTLTVTDNLILGGHDMYDPTLGVGTLTISNGGKVTISGTLRIFNDSSVTLDGGSIRFNAYNRSPDGIFDYRSGTVQIGGDHLIGADNTIRELFGTTPNLEAGMSLIVEGTATLRTTFTLDGGTFGFNAYTRQPEGVFTYSSGTIFLFGDRAIGSDAAITEFFGDTPVIAENKGLTIEGEATLQSSTSLTVEGLLTVQNGLTVAADAAIGGGGIIDGDLTLSEDAKFQFFLDSTLTVTGEVLLDSSFGIDDLLGLDSEVALGSYILIDGTTTDFALLNLQNWGAANAYDLGDGKSAYFSQGSLTVEVVETIPEPGSVLMVLFGAGVWYISSLRSKSQSRMV